MTTTDLLALDELPAGASSPLGEPVPIVEHACAAAVTVRATFTEGATGPLVATVTAEGDTQGGQAIVLFAPGTEEPAQVTEALRVLAAGAVRARVRNGSTGEARDVSVRLAVR